MDTFRVVIVILIIVGFLSILINIQPIFIQPTKRKFNVSKLKQLISNYSGTDEEFNAIKDRIKKCNYIDFDKRHSTDPDKLFIELKKQCSYNFGYVIGDGYGSKMSIEKLIKEIQEKVRR